LKNSYFEIGLGVSLSMVYLLQTLRLRFNSWQ